MNITLTLDPEVEKGLLARAQERGLTCVRVFLNWRVALLARAQERGLALDAYLEELVTKEAALAAATQRSGKAKAQAFVAWAQGHRSTKPLSDDAISRANLYPDRP